jgi:ApaG protein
VFFLFDQSCSFTNKFSGAAYRLKTSQLHKSLASDTTNTTPNRNELWKSISSLEKNAVGLLSSGDESKNKEAFKLLSQSISLKKSDPFIQLAEALSVASHNGIESECLRLLAEMEAVKVPPHLENLIKNKKSVVNSEVVDVVESSIVNEEVDPGSTFSDTVTEKIRVKVSSFYDKDKSDPENGKFMFWYKVAIYNEGPEPVQIVARMWEIEKCRGEKEIVRGAGIMSTQPIIPPGDVFTYQSVCPMKVFPPKGKRVIGSMSGAYTMCKGNMGQHNFSVKVGKFNLILPETVVL